MSALVKDLVFLILQFLDEEGFKETAHKLEQESGFYFDMKYFEDMILCGNWGEAEKYLCGFTNIFDNEYSTKIFFEIRKQNFLDALDKNEHAKALDILMKDLKVFAPDNEDLFKEMTQLLTLSNIREHDSLSMYGDTESARKTMMLQLEKIIKENPLFNDKLTFPSIKGHRLRRIINQGLNWQHINCTHPQPNPNIRTLFLDHVCLQSEDHLCPMSSEDNPQPSPITSMPAPSFTANLESVLSIVTHSEISSEPVSVSGSTNLDGLGETDVVSKKLPLEISDRETSGVTDPGESLLNVAKDFSTLLCPDRSIFITDDFSESPFKNNTLDSCRLTSNAHLPTKVARILNEGSSPMSMDFHPVQQTILLVGTIMGEIGLWEVTSGEKLLWRNFMVWNIGACSMKFKTALHKDPCVSVNRIAWDPEGSLFGVAYSKHIVQMYSYLGANDVRQKLEIDAHVGGVNDLAFSAPENRCLVITCGDDKTVKGWDVTTGVRIYSFEGHDAPVYSLCPHITKNGTHFFFSTSVDGNIKAWLYDVHGHRVDFDAPGLGRTSLAYSADKKRLFSCGTSKAGESFVVEWNESKGTIERIYEGLQLNSLSVVKFDVMKSQFLAAGDESVIKVWDMDKVELFTIIDADGGLPENPCIRFNKYGTLLAVFANENKIKILATDCNLQSLHLSKNCSSDASRVLSDTFRKLAINSTSSVACAGVADEAPENRDSKSLEAMKCESTGEFKQKIFEINKPTLCQTLWLPSRVKPTKILRLAYNNAGNALLALTSNAFHLFWKWQVNDLNLSGKATTEVLPRLWQPKSCSGLMTNDLTGTNHDETPACFALSKNDSYLMSASGGKISLFNLITFKSMLSIMPPPPATTCLAFLPQDNNVVAIGSDDSTIIIYNVRLAKVISKLVGHSKRLSSLAFSKDLNMLVSSGADAQIFVWRVEGWEKHKSRFMQIADTKKPMALSDTDIQFHQDQTRFLAVHETSLAIYEAKNLECLKQWVTGDNSAISHATFSCDSQMVYAAFVDGSVSIFDASHLEIRGRILFAAYCRPCLRSDYALVIAAHPHKPCQFALGLASGGVVVFEPVNPAGKWSELPPDVNGSTSTSNQHLC